MAGETESGKEAPESFAELSTPSKKVHSSLEGCDLSLHDYPAIHQNIHYPLASLSL